MRWKDEDEDEGGFVNVKVNESLVTGGWWRVTRNEKPATRNSLGFPRRARRRGGIFWWKVEGLR